MRQVPAESDSAQVWIHEDRAVAVVPAHAQQPRLSRTESFQTFREFYDRRLCAARNRFKNIPRCREPCFQPCLLWMNGAGHDAAKTRDQPHVIAHGNNASGCADDIDYVSRLCSRTDSVPMRVKRAYWNGNAGLKA